jgi:glycerol-3-phosphate acyltransferase PlsY
MQGLVVAMLDIGKALIPCAMVLGIIHAKDIHNHSIYDLGLAICLGVEGHVFGDLGVQQ